MSTLCLQYPQQNFAIVPDLCGSISRKRSRESSFSLDLGSYEDLDLLRSLQSPKREKTSSSSAVANQAPEFQAFDPSVFCDYFESRPGGPLNIFSAPPPPPSGMQQSHVAAQSIIKHTDQPGLLIKEQPEEYYRARYGSEGVRAPLKGLTENYPTVQVIGLHGRFTGSISVKLVHEDGSAHSSCSLDSSEDRKHALSKKIAYSSNAVEFEDLRIRREKKKEGRKATANEKIAAKEGRDDKKACLLFTAMLETADCGVVNLSALSSPISLTTAPEPAELDLIHPAIGHFGGQDLVIIKGSKMTSPKVSFRVNLPTGQVELHGTVDKERSHQNVLLVKTPSLHNIMDRIQNYHRIAAEVVVTTGRNQMSSNKLQFEFIQNHVCRECKQLYPQASSPHPPMPHTQPPAVCSPQPATPAISVVSPMPITEFSTADSNVMVLSDTLCHPAFSTDGSLAANTAISPTVNPSGYCITANIQSPSGISIHVPSTPPSQCQTYDHEDSLLTPVSSVYALQTVADSHVDKPNEDSNIMLLVEKLMEEQEQSQPMYGTSFGMEQGTSSAQVGSPFLPDVSNATSPASDTLCYSPVTPVQSPADGAWNCIEIVLTKLVETGQIAPTYFEYWKSQCKSQNPLLFNAYVSSHNDDTLFLQQLLASQKLPPFTSTHQ